MAGIHWIVLQKIGNSKVWIFDPLGPKNYRPYEREMRQTLKAQGINKVVFYPHKVQDTYSVHCGQYSELMGRLIEQEQADGAPMTVRGLNGLAAEAFPGGDGEGQLKTVFGTQPTKK